MAYLAGILKPIRLVIEGYLLGLLDRMKKKISYVTFDGRTVVDTEALLQDPGVQKTLKKLSASNNKLVKNGRANQISILKRSPMGV